jgi:hypothetical protein
MSGCEHYYTIFNDQEALADGYRLPRKMKTNSQYESGDPGDSYQASHLTVE